jgi:hypothetical protein
VVVGHLENEKIFEDDVIHGTSELLLAEARADGNATPDGKRFRARKDMASVGSRSYVIYRYRAVPHEREGEIISG